MTRGLTLPNGLRCGQQITDVGPAHDIQDLGLTCAAQPCDRRVWPQASIKALEFVRCNEHGAVGRQRLDHAQPLRPKILCLIDKDDWKAGLSPNRNLRPLKQVARGVALSLVLIVPEYRVPADGSETAPAPQQPLREAVDCYAFEVSAETLNAA